MSVDSPAGGWIEPSAPPSTENDPTTALRVRVSKLMPSSAPSQEGALIGQRQLSLTPLSGPESARPVQTNGAVVARGGDRPTLLPLCSSKVPTTVVPCRAVARMRALPFSSTSR